MPLKYRRDISAEYLRSVLAYDPEIGIFIWRYRPDMPRKWNTRWAGKRAGYVVRGHIKIQIDGDAGHYAHRLAWLYMTDEWPVEQIDHINGVRADNRWSNLRAATDTENKLNKGPQANGSSGYRGVYFIAEIARWRVRITREGHTFSVGMFDTLKEAVAARRKAEQELFGEFARR